jgi:hypothetical protein
MADPPDCPADANLDDQAEYEQLDGGCQRLKAPERQHACHDHDESRRDGRRQNRRHLAEPPHEVRRSGQWREIVGDLGSTRKDRGHATEDHDRAANGKRTAADPRRSSTWRRNRPLSRHCIPSIANNTPGPRSQVAPRRSLPRGTSG